jgi:diguanylate cyclase (GGDEF)-like protein
MAVAGRASELMTESTPIDDVADDVYTVLIIDDSPEDRETYRRLLTRDSDRRFIFLEAESAEAGLELWGRAAVDCVLLDYHLPDADGLDLLDSFADPVGPPKVAVVMLTGRGDELIAVQAMKRGVQDYLAKGQITGKSLARAVVNAVQKVYLLRQLEAQRQELERLATTDSLTGVSNRRVFLRRLDLEIDRARRYGPPLSILMLDLDHFKAINDTHGHLVGDRVLIALARVLSEQRRTDFVGRFGGEEFCVLLPSTDREGAGILAERLRVAVTERIGADLADIGLRVTCSIGAAQFTPDLADAHALIDLADRALYRAKNAGRDRVCLA